MSKRLNFCYREETDYGQDILELAGMVAGLMNKEEVYQKTKTKEDLMEIKKKAQSIVNKLTLGYIDAEEYVGVKGVQ